jgi:REP element-mobilizing transposase RayT
MKPTRNCRRTIGGIIARYQEAFGIQIYAYTFLSNHYHMLIKAPFENTDEFMENVNREIARRLNFQNGRSGQFWSRRYDDQEVLSEDDLLEAFLYVTTNATRHGLVEDAAEWPGLSSIQQSLTGRTRRFSFFHHSEKNPEKKTTTHFLKLATLPIFASLSPKQRQNKISTLLQKRITELHKTRASEGGAYLGAENIQSQSVYDRPQKMARSPRPPCYTKCSKLRYQFVKKLRALRAKYQEASFLFRLGHLNITFPRHTFRPLQHRRPRIVPFTPLDPVELPARQDKSIY